MYAMTGIIKGNTVLTNDNSVEKYNAKKLCHCMGIGMSVITILVGIMAINKRLLQNNYFVFIFVALVSIDVVVTIVVSNKFCKENSKYK